MTTADDGVREIHLSGKQLVFLFMAVTVVSVVIFLCGVLVGRGVQTRSADNVVDAPALGEPAATDAAPAADAPSDAATSRPTPRDGMSFQERLEKNETPAEKLVPQKETPPKVAETPRATVPAAEPAPPPATAPPEAAPPASAAAEPARTPPPPAVKVPDPPTPGIRTEPRGTGYAIQVAALNGRDEAESMVTRLTGKGYSAYVVAPQAGQPAMYRVRVGKFQERAEAEKVAGRLEREEQFKPWITR
jgi:DedD protein